ncbi:tRNA (adenosine(37)-N6)-threonylcarbamoyltransferase complex transferase subunit TsaD [Candidatus Parcubacteria bacterium]|nr:tRNA (adenosine(37)-N6)-threonylcarbamoyltransferase complex transferase subunit TsaD [Candidatus Parcubacteria bacterium]
MKILAIETSCDDTCVAVLEINKQKVKILSNIVSSQAEIHKKYGGIYPTMAIREHQKNLEPVLKKALGKAKLSKFRKPNIDAVAVTIGPGLEPCLWVGVNFAKELSCLWDLPIIPVNHIEAHILANWLPPDIKIPARNASRSDAGGQNTKYLFPAICLVVSGGHTQLILMKGIGKYKILGETRDDAAGECFDKTARILGLDYPGGPAISAEAAKLQTINYKLQTKLPRPMLHSKDYDFSFSGLKTAVLYDFKKRPEKTARSKKYIQEMCREIQQAIIDVLIFKTIKAAKQYKAKSIILGGGVTANKELRRQFNHKLQTINYKLKFLVPPKIFCTDNAAMIAITAYYHKNQKTKNWKNIKVNANLKV